jgi:hypothetical protein
MSLAFEKGMAATLALPLATESSTTGDGSLEGVCNLRRRPTFCD